MAQNLLYKFSNENLQIFFVTTYCYIQYYPYYFKSELIKASIPTHLGPKNVKTVLVGNAILIDDQVGVILTLFNSHGELVKNKSLQLFCRPSSQYDHHLTLAFINGPIFSDDRSKLNDLYYFFSDSETAKNHLRSTAYSRSTCYIILKNLTLKIHSLKDLFELNTFEYSSTSSLIPHKSFTIPQSLLPVEISHDNSLKNTLNRILGR